MGVLTPQQLEQIRVHRYQGFDHSVTVKYVLNRWWEYVTRLMPLWLAYVFLPNIFNHD
jgi:hypothetical protein